MAKIEKASTEKHEGDAVCVAYWNNHVFSGGADGKIKIWDNDLNLIKTVEAHEAYIYALVVHEKSGKVYSSSCDGCVKFMLPPNFTVEELVRCDDAIQSMYLDGDILFTGDDKGVVTNWENDKMLFKFNLVEEVKSLAAQGPLIYTVRDWDVVVSVVVAGKSGKYSNKAVIPGKSPLVLLGPKVEGKFSFLAFADRTGMGLIFIKNAPDNQLNAVWHAENCHDMIINSICGTEKFLYSGGYDNKVKAWTDLEAAKPTSLGSVDVGSCVNAICCGCNDEVFIATSDGIIRRAKFT